MSRPCCACPAVVEECMGFTLVRDFVAADAGLLPWEQIRVLCPACVERAAREGVDLVLEQAASEGRT